MPTTKIELFKKYNIKEQHSVWDDNIDNWMSVEIFREMHDGRLPTPEDTDASYITGFLDKCLNPKYISKLMSRNDFGSLYSTAKRMVYRYHEQLLN
jgi:hypothetical protein